MNVWPYLMLIRQALITLTNQFLFIYILPQGFLPFSHSVSGWLGAGWGLAGDCMAGWGLAGSCMAGWGLADGCTGGWWLSGDCMAGPGHLTLFLPHSSPRAQFSLPIHSL